MGAPSGANEYLTGTWPQILTNSVVHAHSAIEFNYNLFDLTVARMFNPNPHLRIRMVSGIGTAWIQQDWKIHYFDSLNNNTTIRNRWHYVGAGLHCGMTVDWFWGNNIYLTGLATMGAYMGSYHNQSKQTATIPESAGPISNSNFYDTRPAFCAQFMLGPCWEKNLGSHRMEIFTGYELNAWFNLQEIRRSESSETASAAKETWLSTSAIALHGLTTRVTFDF